MNSKLLLLTIVVFTALLSGCTTKSDTYVHENNPAEYIELYADQQFIVVQDAGFCGTWRIHDGTLHLYFDNVLLYTLQPDGSSFIDRDGDRWVRK